MAAGKLRFPIMAAWGGDLQLKIKYEFCNETVEIEVDDEWGAVVLDLNRQEHNINQTETRRHCSLEAYNLDETLLPSEEDVSLKAINKNSLEIALPVLTPRQRYLIQKVFFEGFGYTELALLEGKNESAIRHAVNRALKVMKNYLK
jgi:RNA polymerase sigma-70 factor (ECF subfamily)